MTESIREFCAESSIDPHVHLREEDEKTMRPLVANLVAGGTDAFFFMPNTEKGLTSAGQVVRYRSFAQNMVPRDKNVVVKPILLVNEQTPLDVIDACVDNDIFDCKFLPLSRTTGSSVHGIRHFQRLLPLGKYCGKRHMRCHYHPETPLMTVDNRDAELVFLQVLDMFLNDTQAVIISEHGTDARCIPTWMEFAKSGRFYVTLTPQHLLTDENDSYGDVRKIFKPPAKTNGDRNSLVQFVEQDHPFVIGASDFAPHPNFAKHVHHGRCACGAYHGKYILPFYAHALDRLVSTPKGVKTFVNFTSRNARKLYGFGPASRKIKFVRRSCTIPMYDKIGPWKVEFFCAGQEILWSMVV